MYVDECIKALTQKIIGMREIEKFYSDLGIQIKNPDGTYRSMYDVLKNASEVYNNITKEEKDE